MKSPNIIRSLFRRARGGNEEDDDAVRSTARRGDESDGDDDDDELDDYDELLASSSAKFSPLGIFLFRLFKKLYGDIAFSEAKRVLSLAATLFFMIGGYWLLRSLKDPVMTSICGVESIPKAKKWSVVVVLGVVFIYNRLVDIFPKHKLFYVLGTFYFFVFSLIAFFLTHPVIGLPNKESDPSRWLGWISYCSIESFGSVMVSLFWSFVNSSVSLESAKSAYGFMVAASQLGAILGPTILTVATMMGFEYNVFMPVCYFIAAGCMLLLQLTMYIYVRKYGVAQESEKEPEKKVKGKQQPGVMEGIHLFVKHNYIKGIFAISCLFMVEVTIVDFTMKKLAKEYFDELYPCEAGDTCWSAELNAPTTLSDEGSKAFARFMGIFGQSTNTLSFVFSLLGTSAVIRNLGLRLTLLLFPSLCLAVIITVREFPLLWVVFGAMMLLKGFSYALNNPTKEILYQPTSSAVKYKSKSWIDIFGARGSKALGSVVTDAFSDNTAALVNNGSFVGICVATGLIFNARFMGKKFDEYTESGYIVGSEEMEEADSYATVGDNNSDSDGDDDYEGESESDEDIEEGMGGVEMVRRGDRECGLEEEGQKAKKKRGQQKYKDDVDQIEFEDEEEEADSDDD